MNEEMYEVPGHVLEAFRELKRRMAKIEKLQGALDTAADQFGQQWMYQPQEQPDWNELKKAIDAIVEA